MRGKIIFFFIVIFFLLTSTPIAYANDQTEVFKWVDSVSGENKDYAIIDLYELFSEDTDPFFKENPTESELEEILQQETLSESSIYGFDDTSFESYPVGVSEWNNVNVQEYSHSGSGESRIPALFARKTESSNNIKNGFVGIYSVDPSVEVHTDPENNKDNTIRKVGNSANVNVILSARVQIPDGGKTSLEGERDSYSLEDYNVESVQLYTSKCGDGRTCQIAEDESGRHTVQFRDVSFPESGPQTLTAQATFSSEIERTVERSYLDCKIIERSGSVDSNNSTDKIDRERKCTTKWEFAYNEDIPDRLVVENKYQLTVTDPDATAQRAEFPGDSEEYYVTGLEANEWSEITYETNKNKQTVIKSTWTYFSSRDQRWDLYCNANEERGASTGEGRLDKCQRFSQYMSHTNAPARPLIAHAFPKPNVDNLTSFYPVVIKSVPEKISSESPNVQNHKSCDGDCNWNIDIKKEIAGENKYSEPTAISFRRQGAKNGELKIAGIARENYEPIEITKTRNVHRANLQANIIADGGRKTNENEFEKPVKENEVLLEILLSDLQTGAPISLEARTGEKIVIRERNGENVYTVRTNSDGRAAIAIAKSETPYNLEYKHQKWYNTPINQQAYTTRFRKTIRTDSIAPENTLSIILRVALTLGLLGYVILKVIRKFSLSPR